MENRRSTVPVVGVKLGRLFLAPNGFLGSFRSVWDLAL
jgi:hypothetical protein